MTTFDHLDRLAAQVREDLAAKREAAEIAADLDEIARRHALPPLLPAHQLPIPCDILIGGDLYRYEGTRGDSMEVYAEGCAAPSWYPPSSGQLFRWRECEPEGGLF